MLSYTLMDRIPLKAEDRTILGKKVKNLRKDGIIPAHVFGNIKEVEHVSVNEADFVRVFKQAGETSLVDLKVGEDRSIPVLIKERVIDPVTDKLLHAGFYQVNLKEKVTVPVPIVLIGEGPESVKMGETVVLQTLSEVNVEALPTDLIENIEVNIEVLKEIGDAVTVADLKYDRTTLTVHAEPEEVVVKLDNAVTEDMKKLLEEQEAEAAAGVEATEAAEGEVKVGEPSDEEAMDGEKAEGVGAKGGEEGSEAKSDKSEEKPAE